MVAKVLSTPHSFARGVLDGVRALLHGAGVAPSEVADLVHGTTVATNALLRRGARTGLLTTAGFRDLLEIRRLRLPRLYDLAWEKPAPLVERALRLEVDERLGPHRGRRAPPGRGGSQGGHRPPAREGVQAVAVCLLHAYADAAHEARLGALLHEALPGVYVALSHQVLPQIQEYERLSTTVWTPTSGPVVARYLEEMEGGLAGLGLSAPLAGDAVQRGQHERGGRPPATRTADRSGPAAGRSRWRRWREGLRGWRERARSGGGGGAERGALLALDMGGTTAKAALILDGALPLAAEAEIGAGVTASDAPQPGGRLRPQPPRGRTWWRSAPGAGACSGWTTGAHCRWAPRAPGPRPARSATAGAGLRPP